MRCVALTTLCLLLAACVSTQAPPDELLPPPAGRQAELTALYDRMSSAGDETGQAAARQGAGGDDRDRRFLDSLWGTRPKNALGARRFGNALAAINRHDEALTWLERAHATTTVGDDLAWIRLEMARCHAALGRTDEAVALLGNRLGTTPLPPGLQQQYDRLLDDLARR
ncbi:MAG: tetratricopeptide repeat protein [Planctomycetes bacterium]|jgi:predicted Zn-dependent protease|nr:tetratricopeptide repeat protein [Planctomycetota bacterium]MCL4728895.1 tetratricopeptide repeat protein [Planctomycetota bacterium]